MDYEDRLNGHLRLFEAPRREEWQGEHASFQMSQCWCEAKFSVLVLDQLVCIKFGIRETETKE